MLTDSRKTKTVLKRIFRFYGYDLPALKESYGAALDSKQFCPLPLNKNQVFASTKVRIPIDKKDGATGYFNVCAAEKLSKVEVDNEENPVKTIINLEGKHQIYSYYSIKKIERSIRLGLAARERFCLLNGKKTSNLKNSELQSSLIDPIDFKRRLIFQLITDTDNDDDDDDRNSGPCSVPLLL